MLIRDLTFLLDPHDQQKRKQVMETEANLNTLAASLNQVFEEDEKARVARLQQFRQEAQNKLNLVSTFFYILRHHYIAVIFL